MKAIIKFLNDFSECVRFANEYRWDDTYIDHFTR